METQVAMNTVKMYYFLKQQLGLLFQTSRCNKSQAFNGVQCVLK